MIDRFAIRALPLLALLATGACTSMDNDLAVALCEQSRNCTLTDERPLYGPPHQQALEQDRREALPPLTHRY